MDRNIVQHCQTHTFEISEGIENAFFVCLFVCKQLSCLIQREILNIYL